MLKIIVPETFYDERKYIVDVLFGEFLGLKYKISKQKEKNYIIKLENNRRLIIEDAFFSKVPDKQSYLNKKFIPKKVERLKNTFTPESNIPVIFGTDNMIISQDLIICGIDIFASSFFMLTRWEELVNNKKRDKHNRFPAINSLAFKNNFLNRPVVNEYLEMLWNMLEYLKINQVRKKNRFRFILTHDVDIINFWGNLKSTFKLFAGDLFRRKNLLLFWKHLLNFIKVKIGVEKDPYNTFDYIMDLSESVDIKSRFYFMSGGLTKYDNHYNINSPQVIEIIRNIKERDHIIGFHPSYSSYNNAIQWRKEKKRLDRIINNSVTEGRQHYLRFEVPETWEIWDKNGMKVDYSMGYADKEGFRCGTCYEFSVFNVKTRERLKLKESPLIVMESSFLNYQNITPEIMEVKVKELIDIVKKYSGNFVFLWHNSSFNHFKTHPYKSVYENIIKYVSLQ